MAGCDDRLFPPGSREIWLVMLGYEEMSRLEPRGGERPECECFGERCRLIPRRPPADDAVGFAEETSDECIVKSLNADQ